MSLSFLIMILALFLGSIPFGLLIARAFRGGDIRTQGSRNIGATNVSRVVGFWPAGVLTFLLDFGKGSLAVFLATPMGIALIVSAVGPLVGGSPESGMFSAESASFLEKNAALMWASGFLAVAGHCFSPFLRFRGGKGVATGLGVMLLLSPAAAGLGVLAFALAFYYKRIVSLASISGVLVASCAHMVLHPIQLHLVFGGALVFLILARHESNLDALLEDREMPYANRG